MPEDKQKQLAKDLYRKLHILAVLTLVFVVLLAAAPFKWHNSEWRDIQKEYNRRAADAGEPSMRVALQQIWRPEIGLTDRCTSCHVGMGAARPLIDGGALYGAHPEVNHNVAQMGCTICHRGQGRATRAADAHGQVEHWEDPMLPVGHLQSSCGTCHGEAARTPPLTAVSRGEYLFQLHGCQACHRVDGQGGDVGPDLSGVALKGYDRQWHIRHLRQPTSVVEGSRMMSFGHLTDQEIEQILTYMDTLIGAPQLIRGKAIAVQLGCRGCHKIGGLGGDFGGDLEETSRKTVADYDFSNVEGPHTLENWHRQHLRYPQRVAPGSTMPVYRLAPEEEDALLTYILSLRRAQIPMQHLPKESVLTRLEGRRDFASDGRSLFEAFCSACHGSDGRGQAMASLGTIIPDLRNPESHSVISPDVLRYSIEKGRPGRWMPAWGKDAGGLSEAEIETIIDYLRDDLPSPPTFQEVSAARADRQLGEKVFGHDCAACHGDAAQGTDIAPSLSNPEFQLVASDQYLYETITRGRSRTAMPAHRDYDASVLAGLIGWIREQGRAAPAERRRMESLLRNTLFVKDLQEYRASGSPAYGKVLFETMCVNCHGQNGRGNLGPAIANPDFLRSASDGFLAGTILLGRGQRAMRSFGPGGLVQLEGREVGDLIVYLRRLASAQSDQPGYQAVQGTPGRGGELFSRYCSGCHGPEGEGLTGPSLRNPAFLEAVTDGFLQATLVRGRPGTAMRSWARGGFGFAELEPQEINDIVSYIRSWQASR